ncbi:MAG: hypothetical protein IRY85_20420 [Micromonosporaceae bacterium]|nr:hypothetical protein [Micromonosporaceae bacterium]
MRLPDGTPVAVTGSHDRTARVWNLTTGRTIHVLAGCHAPLMTTSIDGCGPVLTLSASHATLRVWFLDHAEFTDDPVTAALPEPAQALAVAADGTLVVGFGADVAAFALPPPSQRTPHSRISSH